ncbi:hypothetical protein UB23_27590 [Pseudomonas sp. ES3-33]|nr:hypothetical protein UB23_27590 [Pseudomonas sp. ES3-33]
MDTVVGPFVGESDDLLFTQAGAMIWKALLEGAVRMVCVAADLENAIYRITSLKASREKIR